MPIFNTHQYVEFKLQSNKLSKCKAGELGSMARVSNFLDMLYIKPLRDLYLRLENKQPLSKAEREEYAKNIYNALSVGELKDKEFAAYYMRFDDKLQVPSFNGSKEYTAFLEKKVGSSDPIKQCMAAVIKNLTDEVQENKDYQHIFNQAIFNNIEQFTKDFKRSGNIIIKQNQEESLIFCQDLSVKKIDKSGNIIFKSSPLVNKSSRDGKLEYLPHALRDYICQQSGLSVETPDKALYNVGKWPKIVGEHINSLGIKEYEIETNDGSLKLGKIVFAEPVLENNIKKYCDQYKLPIMVNYTDIENRYLELKQEILDYQNQKSNVRIDDSIEHIQAYLNLNDQEIRNKLVEEDMARYKDHQLDLIAFIKLLKEDYKLPDQDINNFINIHHQGLVTGMQSGFLPEIFRADQKIGMYTVKPAYHIGDTTLICDKNGIKTLQHVDTIDHEDFNGNRVKDIANVGILIDFSNQGKPKHNMGYNNPPGMNNLTAVVHYTASSNNYAKIEIGDNIPLEKVKYANPLRQILHLINHALSKIVKIFVHKSSNEEHISENQNTQMNDGGQNHSKRKEEMSPIVKPSIARSKSQDTHSRVP